GQKIVHRIASQSRHYSAYPHNSKHFRGVLFRDPELLGYGTGDCICCTIDPMNPGAARFVLVLVLGVSLLTAAAKAKKEKKGAATQGTAPATATAGAFDFKNFVIGPEDVLVIRVWRDPEVSGQVVVRPDGRITLQLLGEIQAAGLSPEGLTQV